MLRCLIGLFCLSAVSQFVILIGINAECPVKLNPQRVVVGYGSSVSVNCSTDVTHDGIGWEASEGSMPMTTDKHVTWSVSILTEWEIQPQCFINYNREQCEVPLPITVYKTPDSVSISPVNHTGPMTEGVQYQLKCDIVNVAPVNLNVKWYKGDDLVHHETFTDTIKTPVNKTSRRQITPNRDDDGVLYRCEAELELGADGPQPPPTVTSKPLNITVHYSPQHISLKETIKKQDGVVILNCAVSANPAATYVWHSEHLKDTETSSVLSSSTLNPGNYTCTAKNPLGKSSKVFFFSFAGSRPTLMTNLIYLQMLVALRFII